MSKAKAAVIGVGSWGKNHARVYYELPNADLVGVFDMNKERAKNIAQQYNARVFNSIDNLINDDEIDIITIATPTTTHAEIALKAIEGGKSILIEKPMTSTVEEAEKIIDAERSSKVKVTIGFIERFNPIVQRSKTLITAKELGNLVLISARRLGPFWPDRLKDVDVIRDVSIHDIDAFRYLTGREPINLYARGGKLRHVYYDYSEILLDFGDGITGFIESNYLTPHKYRRLMLTCERGIVEADYIKQEYIVEDEEWIRTRKAEKKEPLKEELSSFVTAYLEDKKPLVTSEDGIKALKIALASIESIKTHKVIELNL